MARAIVNPGHVGHADFKSLKTRLRKGRLDDSDTRLR